MIKDNFSRQHSSVRHHSSCSSHVSVQPPRLQRPIT